MADQPDGWAGEQADDEEPEIVPHCVRCEEECPHCALELGD